MSAVAVTTERRQSIRHPIDREVNVVPTIGGSGSCWRGRIKNLSLHGLRLILERRFEKNTFLSIRVLDNDRDELMSFFGKVVYVSAYDDGRWSIGCRFTKEMNEQDLQDLLDA